VAGCQTTGAAGCIVDVLGLAAAPTINDMTPFPC
jgi:hypothetical protein